MTTAAELRPLANRRTCRTETPALDPQLAHLGLTALRAYRQELREEEDRVSYWRRIIQARLDLVQERNRTRMHPDVDGDTLLEVLGEARMTSRRQALLSVVPHEGTPPLPNLMQLWTRAVDGDDPTQVAEHIAELGFAEHKLSTFRRALHERLAGATSELIARYHNEPNLCLHVLPLDR
jgi:anti-sigma-K factor RsiG